MRIHVLFSPTGDADTIFGTPFHSAPDSHYGTAPRTLKMVKVSEVLRTEGMVLEALDVRASIWDGVEIAIDVPRKVADLLFQTCLA